jgi:hypothetical protein
MTQSIKIRTPNKDDVARARAIAKKHGVKHCKRGTAKYSPLYIGRQCVGIDQKVGEALVKELNESGFYVEPHSVESIRLDIADVLTVQPFA